MGASKADAVYAYCLVRVPGSTRLPADLGSIPSGLPSTSQPRPVRVDDDLWLVVSEAPLAHYSAEAIAARLEDLEWVSERALAHEAVVEHFLPAEAVLPMKLFTLFESEASALAHLRSTKTRTDDLLRRLGGRVEWGVRIRFDPRRAVQVGGAGGSAPRAGKSSSSGRAFLERKSADRRAAKEARAEAGRMAEACFSALAAASEAAWRAQLPPGPAAGGLLVDAAFLTKRSSSPAPSFDNTLRSWAERLQGVATETVLTGPWPPYHFMGST